jgi:hypothetical protein
MVGRYVNAVSGRDTNFITLAWQDRRLGARVGPNVRALWVLSNGRVIDPVTTDTFRPERDASGRIVAIRHQNAWQDSKERRMPRAGP